MTAPSHPHPRPSTAEDHLLGSSDDVTTPRAQSNPHFQPQRSEMDHLTPNMAPQRSESSKGKGRAQEEEQARSDEAYGYEAYREPEYLSVRPHPQRTRSGEFQQPLYPDVEPRGGTYQQRHNDLEMGMDSVGNRNGVGAMELGNAAYPPVSEEDAEERRIKEVSRPC